MLLRTLWQAGFPRVLPTIVDEFPHDDTAYTQGLLFHDGELLESTGLYNNSSLRRLDPRSKQPIEVIGVKKHWGEGIGVIDKVVYQLTFESELALKYSFPELELIGNASYNGEGWGLTSANDQLLMSNGSNSLFFRDKFFSVVREIRVTLRGFRLGYLNDLTWANGKIYCNRMSDSCVYEISPQSGKVLRIIDCSELVALACRERSDEHLNGICYLPEEDALLLTGKNWPKIFSVKL